MGYQYSEGFMQSRKEMADRDNAKADEISALQVGDGISAIGYSQRYAGSVIKVSAKRIEMREDHAELINGRALKFHAGGFAAHCSNQEIQQYDYAPNPDGYVRAFSLRSFVDQYGFERRRWVAVGQPVRNGSGCMVGRHHFYDYNF